MVPYDNNGGWGVGKGKLKIVVFLVKHVTCSHLRKNYVPSHFNSSRINNRGAGKILGGWKIHQNYKAVGALLVTRE